MELSVSSILWNSKTLMVCGIVVFCQREVFGGKARQCFAVLVCDRNSLDDELRTDLQGEGRLLSVALQRKSKERTDSRSAKRTAIAPPRQEGWRDIKKKREASFDGADGVVWSRNSWTTPPRLRD